MKIQIFLKKLAGLAIGSCLLVGLGSWQNKESGRSDDFAMIKKDFKNPPAEYRTVPFTVWNGKVTEAEIDRMLREAKDAGCGGVFIHPRPGMITEYLSDEWFSLYKHAVDVGKKLGLDIWIYDENSYPSGFAGGHVPVEMPASYNQGQGLALTKTDRLPEDAASYFLCLKKEGEKWTDITGSINAYKGIKADYYLYKKTYMEKSDWYGGHSYVDLLVPGVTEKFLDLTMKGYEKTLKDSFGSSIKGIFSDEPNISSPGGLRWTPDLFRAFREKWGYDLKPLLPLLQEETGDWKRVRHNYMETLLQLFIDRWSKPFHAYCERNDLKWTGHYWEHGWPQMNEGPDNMAMYAWHQVPAIDMLFNQFNEESPVAQFGNVRAVKELRSAANQMGYSRTLSETYGGGGWENTFKDFKRLGDWEYVLGVNFMNQHLAHMTLTGARKYDYPPVFTYHSPWWSDYRELNDYYGRLSFVLSKGVQQNDVLILEPNSTLWSYYSHTGSSPKLMEIGQAFQTFVTTLEKNQVEYDLGSENIIKDQGRVADGKFIVGKAAYTTIVLPPLMETLNQPTFEMLQDFAKQGGRIVAFSSPTLVDGAENADWAALLNAPAVERIDGLTAHVIREKFSNPACGIAFEGGSLYHQRRRFADGELLFLVNSSMTEAVDGKAWVRQRSVVRMDAMTGEIYAYPFRQTDGKVEVDFHLEPAGSLLLYCSGETLKGYPAEPAPAGTTKLAAQDEVKVKRLKENALTIDFCDLTVKGQTTPRLYFAQAADRVFREYGFANGNPWNTSVQYKRNILDRDTFRTGGFGATYYFTVNDKFDYSSMQLVAERPELYTVKVNGQTLRPRPGAWWLDRSFGVYAIGDLVKQGKNKVELSVYPMSIFAEIEPVYIIGDFSVIPEKAGWSINAPVTSLTLGSWKEQGQPFYSWGVGYSKEYEVKDLSKPYAVRLNHWNGTVAEVYVNGQKAGIIAFDPYKLDVTSYLKKGKNVIDIHVIGSHKNLLGPHYNDPASGFVSPWHWKNIKEQIPGTAYQMLDYGLMEDFDLVY